MRVGEDQRQIAPLLGLLAVDLKKERRVGDGVEDDRKSLRQGQRHRGLFACSELHHVERHPLDGAFNILRHVIARAPEDLAHVFGEGKRIRVMRGDAANALVDRERDLDQLVERRFVIGRAQRAIIVGVIEGLEPRARLEHAAASRAQHVPRHVEQSKPRRMDKAADGLFLVETMRFSIGERIDAVERSIRVRFNRCLQSLDHRRIGGLPQKSKQCLRVSHRDPRRSAGRSIGRVSTPPAPQSKRQASFPLYGIDETLL